MVNVLGVYAVPEAPEPCHLVEMVVPRDTDFREITQMDPDQPRSHWQVPWDERVLEEIGTETRVAFFRIEGASATTCPS